MTPALSIVLPVRDDAGRLRIAIDSVLERAENLLEVVVVDDGSADGSADVAEAFGPPVRVFRRPALGVAAARNFGVTQTRGQLLGFVDSDDEWIAPTPDPRRRMLAERPHSIALGRVLVVADADTLPSPPGVLYLFGAALIPRVVMDRVGPSDDTLAVGSDLAWFMTAKDIGIEINVADEVVLRYRRRPGSLSTTVPGRGLLAGLHHAIQRRAAAGE
jgi:glycosyltransferase involved in cell wall biosynthesis